MTYAERLLDHLRLVAPDGATNSEIARRLGIRSHQTVYMLTQELLRRGLIHGEQKGREWIFSTLEKGGLSLGSPETPVSRMLSASGPLIPGTFEALARRILSERYGTRLAPGSVPDVRKQFDFVSADRQVIGDARYYTLVRGSALPPAKFATIAEYVWLLDKTGAPTTFLVFGNDRQVPLLWLERYGNLASTVAFYFLTDDGEMEQLARPAAQR